MWYKHVYYMNHLGLPQGKGWIFFFFHYESNKRVIYLFLCIFSRTEEATLVAAWFLDSLCYTYFLLPAVSQMKALFPSELQFSPN